MKHHAAARRLAAGIATGCMIALAGCTPRSGMPVSEAGFDTDSMAQAAWQLLPDQSRLNFISVKNSAHTEVHSFPEVRGMVDAQGVLTLQVALASVDTGIDIRDQRMRDLLFKVDTHPLAQVTANVDASQLNALAPGEHAQLQLGGSLQLSGIDYPLPLHVRVTRLDAQRWLAVSERPAIVPAVNFGLINGIDELRKLAGLRAIASEIPVTFSLVFEAGSAGSQ